MMHAWLEDSWRQLVELGERMPHALLFAGPPGVGKRDLVDALAARLLCRAPRTDGHACGECSGCALRLSGNHPDLLVVTPPESEADPDADGKAVRKSGQIVIDQIRVLTDALAVTGHQSSRRVVIVEPAEAMNVYTANALLKLLEEPPVGCVLLLVSASPRRLLPTIRSRCRAWPVPRPSAAQVSSWSAGHDGDAALLDVAGGMPLAAERLAQRGFAPLLARFTGDLGRLPDTDPLELAGRWDAWLKSKEVAASGLDIAQVVDWMQRWVADLAALRLGGRVRFFPAHQALLAQLSARAGIAALSNCYNEFARIRRVAQHPLNSRLMLEDMLLRYTRALSGSRS
jgi:DNA polymerase-3 subunit delta'